MRDEKSADVRIRLEGRALEFVESRKNLAAQGLHEPGF
jgi:hypothetical protein